MPDERSIIDERLERTATFFEPTLPQAGEQDAEEAPDGAGEKQARPAARKTRRYEKEHPAFRLRIRPQDNERLKEMARRYSLTRDALAAAVVQAGLDALEDGHLFLQIERTIESGTDRAGRRRDKVVTEVEASWSCQE
jgi:hypothetical protein